MIEAYDTDVSLAEVLKALAHPARLRILRLLATRGTCICGELVEMMPLSQATVSQHLKVLKEVGLVVGTIDGPRSCYCIDHAALSRLRDLVVDLFGAIGNCCQPSEEDSRDQNQ
ncbi:MAG: metalloregulator ArsR/SmtB family transcription factor [Hyphomicrobiales bacterium]